MEPSHVRKYSNFEIEVIVAKILKESYPTDLNIPIGIDWIAENHPLVDDIVPIELLEDKFNIAAVLTCKPNGHFDILVDEDTLDFQPWRANFSIAHEFGHIVLHSKVCLHCKTIEDSIELRNRISRSYSFIERNANYFAGAILIPQKTLHNDIVKLYDGLTRLYGFDINLISSKLYSRLAERYCVNLQPMEIRLEELSLKNKILSSLRAKSPYLDI
jgi:hypothetical protein